MEIISVTKDNLAKEHICCAISNEKDCQVASKKAWMAARFDEGLVFKKGNVRGKCFIEYVPAARAWAPVEAEGWMYIDCLWVSGQFKGQGYSTLLLDDCIADSRAKGMAGLVTLSSAKKRGFLADKKYLLHKGFQVCDRAAPDYELMCLPFGADAQLPRFKARVRAPHTDIAGFALYYAHQCPFTAKYVPILAQLAAERGLPFQAIRFTCTEEAQNAPAPFATFSLFYDGAFITNEIPSEKKFVKLMDTLMPKAEAQE